MLMVFGTRGVASYVIGLDHLIVPRGNLHDHASGMKPLCQPLNAADGTLMCARAADVGD